ncbi:PREDICTED: uncharacterized protein LOC105110955 isoform X2 [Populus euphratica]|uniref:Uncharacterized protein LOC105110955 isoform X2 n=1 Tax=Populus euphratica TaxID=75702 RepID=A0AAJ6T547_POPEU|nr:PREDICTED: uncharacterized protein LOC105110955 isoform X2 [Populus euphratica]
MRRDSNLDLCLSPMAPSSSSPSTTCHQNLMDIEPAMRQQHLTIFYNGRISVCDVTEFQVCPRLETEEQSTISHVSFLYLPRGQNTRINRNPPPRK